MFKKIKSFFSNLFLNWKAEENLIKQCNRMTPLHRKVSNAISIFLVFAIIVWLCSFPSSASEESNDSTILSGSYTFNDNLYFDSLSDNLPYTASFPFTYIEDFSSIGLGVVTMQCDSFVIAQDLSGYYIEFNVVSSSASLGEYPFLWRVFRGWEDNHWFDSDLNVEHSKTIIINNDVSVPSLFENWFDHNLDLPGLVPFNKGLYRVNYFWYQSDISTQLDGMEFYSLNEGDLYTSINVQNDQLIFDEDNGDMHVMARYTTTGAKWIDNSGQFVYFINDESIPQSLAEQIPTLLEYIPDVSLTEFQRMQDSWYYGVLDGFTEGYNQASRDTEGTFLGNIFGGVFDALDKFQMFGQFSFLDFIKSIIGIFALIWFLKLLAGG